MSHRSTCVSVGSHFVWFGTSKGYDKGVLRVFKGVWETFFLAEQQERGGGDE